MRAIPVTHTPERAAIGSRLRAARQRRQLTLDQVASSTGLTKGFVSRVERDMVSPSVTTLVAICDVVQIEIGDLFAAPEVQLVRAEDAPQINLGGTGATERLMTPRSEERVQVIRSTVAPGASGGADLYTINAKIDVLLVLSGAITVRFIDSTRDLGPGDALTFDGCEPHSWESPGGADVVWVLAGALG